VKRGLDDPSTTESAEKFLLNVEGPTDQNDKDFAGAVGVRRSLLDELKLAGFFVRYHLWEPLLELWMQSDIVTLKNALEIERDAGDVSPGDLIPFYSMDPAFFSGFPKFTMEKTRRALEEIYWRVRPDEVNTLHRTVHRLSVQVEAFLCGQAQTSTGTSQPAIAATAAPGATTSAAADPTPAPATVRGASAATSGSADEKKPDLDSEEEDMGLSLFN